jgi:hypothetical protein
MNKAVHVDKLPLASPTTAPEGIPIRKSSPPLAQAAGDEPDDDFDWDNPEENSIVLREQRATAVYRNRAGEVIIRQRSWPDDDAFIYIAPDNAVAFMEGMAEKLRK